MSFGTLLYSFLLMPIQLVFEVVFSFAYTLTNERIGLAIVALSLAINILILPLYRRADAMQEEERLLEAKLHPGVSHIKKTFRGDERTMMLRTYYRQNNYSPLFVLRGAVSLLLEIPFFIVAYRFLSGLSLLQGVSFGPISDLGSPDHLITINDLPINVLPIIMTLINVISTIIFTKGSRLKTKIQLYAMAAFFLIFLYTSPSGLVFYWTLNNLFSLVKTLFYKLKNPQRVLRIVLVVAGTASIGFGVFTLFRDSSYKRMIIFTVIGVLLFVPFIVSKIREKHDFSLPKIKTKPNKKLFWGGAVFMTVLTGFLIPSAVVTASPQEFIVVGVAMHPIWYVVGSFLIAAGFFILWMNIFYYLFSDSVKVVIERLLFVAGGVGIIDYLFFGNNLGTLSAELVFDNEVSFSALTIIINLALVIAVAAGLILLIRLKPRIVFGASVAASVAMTCMSGVNAAGIFKSVAEVDLDENYRSGSDYKLPLSKEGKNVVVFMLDRALGEYLPYMMSQNPELEKMYSGFTFYSNTVSFGGHTNMTTPSLFGGYEYTPVELNKRDKESLKDKHDEALKVLPVLFDNAGYDVTVCDPPYAGYREIPDLSIYDQYKNINSYLTQYSMQEALQQQTINTRVRNLFSYSLFKTAPSCFGSALYDDGNYNQLADSLNLGSYWQPFQALKNLSEHTVVSDNKTGSFIMMDNEATHDIIVDSSAEMPKTADGSDVPGASELTVDGVTLHFDNFVQSGEYQVDFASLIEVGKWLEYLKEQDLYDNTRIIIVSDHGFSLRQIEELFLDDTVNHIDLNQRYGDVEFYYPLLMVKDYNSKGGITTSKEFMTNADVPTLATAGIFEKAINPFTGNEINNSEKTAHDQYILGSDKYIIAENNGNCLVPGRWYSVHDSIWDKSNWKLEKENGVLPY